MRLSPVTMYKRVRHALRWRLRRLVSPRSRDRAVVTIARCWRSLLRKPTFIGITGSAGKTTTKELLTGVLSHKWPGIGCQDSLNELPEIATTLLRVRPTHEFCVAEMSEDRPGVLDASLALLKPSVGIVTVVGNDHWSAFKSRDAIAREVRKLVHYLPATGTAVLNIDDPLVGPMAQDCRAKVISYGTSPEAELRAETIESGWPDRLQLTVVLGEERIRVQTQLCGSHWVPSVLGAIAGGLAMGMTLRECATGIARIAPYDGRMQPVTTPNGVTFIRDDFKAPLWTVDACLDFMRSARATRKILVIGTLSDCGTGAPGKYVNVAKRAQDVADVTIFVGAWASHVLKARRPGREDALRVFLDVRDAAHYVRENTRAGDLVLLKGTNKRDHLLRIVMASADGIACWRSDCKRYSFCNACPDRNTPSGAAGLSGSMPFPGAAPRAPRPPLMVVESDEPVLVGLGNPGPKYMGTPHNLGYEVVGQLAASLGLTWIETPEAWIARGSCQDRTICLLKLRTAMNLSGATLKALSEAMGFSPGQCILVQDDLDMAIGSVRTRLSGGAGGHRGVASILEAFQTDAFRRIKVGVGQAAARINRVEYVLTPFDATSRLAIEPAIRTAQARALEMLTSRTNGG